MRWIKTAVRALIDHGPTLAKVGAGMAATAAITWAGGGSGMPWDTGLNAVNTNIVGTTAKGIGGVGAAASFAPHVFHTEFGQLFHTGAKVFVAVGGALGSTAIIASSGVAGALI